MIWAYIMLLTSCRYRSIHLLWVMTPSPSICLYNRNITALKKIYQYPEISWSNDEMKSSFHDIFHID